MLLLLVLWREDTGALVLLILVVPQVAKESSASTSRGCGVVKKTSACLARLFIKDTAGLLLIISRSEDTAGLLLLATGVLLIQEAASSGGGWTEEAARLLLLVIVVSEPWIEDAAGLIVGLVLLRLAEPTEWTGSRLLLLLASKGRCGGSSRAKDAASAGGGRLLSESCRAGGSKPASGAGPKGTEWGLGLALILVEKPSTTGGVTKAAAKSCASGATENPAAWLTGGCWRSEYTRGRRLGSKQAISRVCSSKPGPSALLVLPEWRGGRAGRWKQASASGARAGSSATESGGGVVSTKPSEPGARAKSTGLTVLISPPPTLSVIRKPQLLEGEVDVRLQKRDTLEVGILIGCGVSFDVRSKRRTCGSLVLRQRVGTERCIGRGTKAGCRGPCPEAAGGRGIEETAGCTSGAAESRLVLTESPSGGCSASKASRGCVGIGAEPSEACTPGGGGTASEYATARRCGGWRTEAGPGPESCRLIVRTETCREDEVLAFPKSEMAQG